MSFADGMLCLRDHLWAAADVARGAARRSGPVLSDLLAAGRRRGFCESPDSLYSVGFLRLGPGIAYRIHVPAGTAFYGVVTVSFGGRQRTLETAAPAASPGRGPGGLDAHDVLLAEGTAPPEGIDTAGCEGLAQVMVRQYFDRGRLAGAPAPPRVARVAGPAGGPVRRWADGLRAGGRFLAWRLAPVAAIKLIRARAGRRFPVNRFLTMDDVLDLWPGGPGTVRRLGVDAFRYAFCRFDLARGEDLEIRFRPRGSIYYAFSVNNEWMQGVDPDYRASYRSSFDVPPGSDGFVVLRLSAQDRPAPGTLATGGRRRGLVHFREILSRSRAELPACRPVPGDTAAGAQPEAAPEPVLHGG